MAGDRIFAHRAMISTPSTIQWLDCSAEPPQRRCSLFGHLGPPMPELRVAHLVPGEDVITLLRCAACSGLIATLPAVAAFGSLGETEAQFEQYYLETGAGIWDMFWPPAMLADAPHKSLLDVGCGHGFMVDIWRTVMDASAAGCDTGSAAERGAALFAAPIYRGSLDVCPELHAQRFDIVYACEVIEHVDDPDQFVTAAAGFLQPDGVLVLTTPNADFAMRDNEPATVWSALSPGYHAFLFTAEGLRQLLQRHGYAHIEVRAEGARLFAWASAQPFQLATDLAPLRERYLTYLRQGSQQESLPPVLRHVLAYRMVRECVFA